MKIVSVNAVNKQDEIVASMNSEATTSQLNISTISERSNSDSEEDFSFDHDSRERTGLRRDDHPRCSRSCDRDITQSHPVGSGQHDLHEYYGQRRNQAEETTMSSRFCAAFRRHVFDWSAPSIFSNNPQSSANSNNKEVVNDMSGDMNASTTSQPSEHGGVIDSSMSFGLASSSHQAHVSDTSMASSSPRHRSRGSPFCPCFSPTVSDSEEEDDAAHPSIPVINEQLRHRLAITGSAANQVSLTARRTSHSGSNDAPVHRIVEYSHHLVPDVDKIYAASYYWGIMDRFKAEQLLDGKPEGTFLLRDSAQTEYLFSVSFRRYQRTLHARIEQGTHRFGFDILDDTVFSSPTVTGLIENYKDPSRCLFFEPQLTHPLHRSTVFSLQELCRAKIVSNTSYSRVAQLRLPSKMKGYVREYHYKVPVRTVIKQHD